MRKNAAVAIVLITSIASSQFVSAMPILTGSTSDGGQTWTASDSQGRDALLEVTVTSYGFDLTLTNLAGAVRTPNEMLVGIIFDFYSDPGLVNPSLDGMQNVTASAIDYQNKTLTQVYGVDYGLNLDGEYAFRDDMASTPMAYLGQYAIAGAAYDPVSISQPIDSSVAYTPPVSTNGAEFGISGGDTSSLVSSIKFWVVDSLTIAFATTGAFSYSMLSTVSFLYGTDFSASVPEPASLTMLGLGLLGLGFSLRRRRNASARIG